MPLTEAALASTLAGAQAFKFIADTLQPLINAGIGIGGIASNMYNVKQTNLANREMVQQNNATQMALAAQANQWSLEQWQRENAYNNPSAQRARLEAAGINPALIYGNGIMNEAASSPAVQMANTQAARNIAPQFDPLTMAQVANLNAQTESVEHATAREDEKQGYNIKLLQREIRVKDSEIALNAQTINKLSSDEQLNYASITRLAVQNTIDQQIADKQCELWNSTIGLQDKEALMTGEQYRQLCAFFTLREENLKASNAELWSRVGVNNANINQMEKLANLYHKQAENDYSNEMVKFRKELVKHQGFLAKEQAKYWTDYTQNPSKYRQHTHSKSSSAHGGNAYISAGSSFSESESW